MFWFDLMIFLLQIHPINLLYIKRTKYKKEYDPSSSNNNNLSCLK
jgi:hypothetical protein